MSNDNRVSDDSVHSSVVIKNLRILVVEDEPLVRDVLIVSLSEDEHEFVTASNGKEGLERFRNDGPFDLILTDRAMPEMSGEVMAREIKKTHPQQPVILLTGLGDWSSEPGGRPPGVDMVVGKPFSLATLRTAIRQVLQG